MPGELKYFTKEKEMAKKKKDGRFIGNRETHQCQRIFFSMILTPKLYNRLKTISKRKGISAGAFMRNKLIKTKV